MPAIDVFVCNATTATTRGLWLLRRNMYIICRNRWAMEPDISYFEIKKSGFPFYFQKMRRVLAEQQSRTPYYICADDDCLPEGIPFVEKAIEILDRHKDFAILSLNPNNSLQSKWTPDISETYENCVGGCVFEDDEVFEQNSVGGIRVCRKGVLPSNTDWPTLRGKQYDLEHCAALRKKGFRVGYYKDIFMNHLGRTYSVTWKPDGVAQIWDIACNEREYKIAHRRRSIIAS